MTEPIHFIAHLDEVRIYRGSKLIGVIFKDKLPALIYEAAKALRQ